MIIEYKEGKMIITHPSGYVTIYNAGDIKKIKDVRITEMNNTQAEIKLLDTFIDNIQGVLIAETKTVQ